MILYDYECDDCEKDYEIYHKYGDKPDMLCTCGGELSKVFKTSPGIKVMNTRMNDGSYLDKGKKVSSAHYRDIQSRKYKKSDKAKHEDGDVS